MRHSTTRLAAAAAFAMGVPSAVLAQAQTTPPSESVFGVEEIVVTGTAVAERTKFDSSVAISTFDAEDIEQQAPASSADLLAAVPGFWVESTSGATQGNVFARGIIQDGGYRYVGLMEDGIPLYPIFELSFYNPDQFIRVDETIERVEALRGGTAPIFTAGAVGGAANFVTIIPGDEAQARAKLGFTDYGQYRGDVAWSAPMSEHWGIAMGGYYRVSDGIREPGYTADEGGQLRVNIVGDFDTTEVAFFGKYINDKTLFAVPIPLQGRPSDPDAVNGQDAGSYSLHSEDLARAGLPPSAAEVGLQGSRLEDGIHPDLWTIGGRVRMRLSDTVSFTNLLRYTDGSVRFDGIFSGDAPVTGVEFAETTGVPAFYTIISTGESYSPTDLVQNHGHWVINKEFRALQDDLRVTFDLGANNLTLGAYFADYSMDDRWSLGNQLLMDAQSRPRRLLLPGATDPNGFTSYSTLNLRANYDAKLYSAYLSDEWSITDALRIDVGVRYDRQETDGHVSDGETVDYDGNPATLYDNSTALAGPTSSRISETFDNVGYSVGLNFEFTDQHAIFGRYTEAAKLPHFDDLRNGVLTKDKVKNAELGYKTSLKNFAAFITLFQTEFDNVPFQDILADGTILVRRAATRTRGVEIEGELNTGDIFTLGFSMTFQDPKYEKFTGSVIDNTDNTIRRIPKEFGRVTPALHFFDDRARLYVTYSYFGKRYANDENTIELPSYSKLDAGVMFDVTEAFRLQVAADNLTNEVGLTEGNPRTDIGASGVGTLYMARPLFKRSYAVSGTVRF